MKFPIGMIVRSINTGTRVRVTGEGQALKSFAGTEIGKPARFCLTHHSWAEEVFVPDIHDLNVDRLWA